MEKYNIEPYKDDSHQRQFEKEEAYIRAKKKLDKLVGFYWHLAVYIVVNIFLIILIGTQRNEGISGFFDFGTFATPFFWGIGLAFHFLGVFGPGIIFGKNWEERKVKKFMEKENQEKRYK
jgi:hypothetical protein